MLKPFYIKKKNIDDRLAPEFLANVKKPGGFSYHTLAVNDEATKWVAGPLFTGNEDPDNILTEVYRLDNDGSEVAMKFGPQFELYNLNFLGSDNIIKDVYVIYPNVLDTMPQVSDLLSDRVKWGDSHYWIPKYGTFPGPGSRTFVLSNTGLQLQGGGFVALFGWVGMSLATVGSTETIVGTIDAVALENILVTKL